ncbi:hypothetical protein BDV93DRAFT_561870 [Ceratobasidium sp. AG-I]|nr:hypothetical protein BDV93DRAFT_561870 [Ceratobasidium sp. AG-I]
MDAPKQGVLFKPRKEKENVLPPSALPRLSVKRDPNQPAAPPVRRVSGSQPTLGAAALRNQVDTLRAENAKLRKEHLRELSKLQEKSSQSEARIQELVREKLARDNQNADAEREQRMTTQREAALRSALERSEAALRQVNERSGKLGSAERRIEDLERIHADEKRKHALELSSLQSQLDVARSTISEQTARLRERDNSRRMELRARELEARLQERETRVRDLEEELGTAEAQAQVYESRVQVYDGRVRAYKERVRAAEERAREAEAENDALLAERVEVEKDGSKELERVKELLERMANAYGELHGRMKEREREARGMEWVLEERGRKMEALEEAVRLAQEEARDLVEEMDARQAERRVEDLGAWSWSTEEELEDPRAGINELLALVHQDKAELREMEIEKLKFLAQFPSDTQPTPPTDFSPLPSPPASPVANASANQLPFASTSTTSLELELRQLRAECAALRAEQESLEQDLVDAAMDAEEHTRKAGEYTRLQREYGALEAEVGRLKAVAGTGSWEGQGELARLRDELGRLQAELASSRAELAKSQSELASSQTDFAQSQGELVDTRTQLANSRTEFARLESERTRLSDEFAAYKVSMEDTARSAAEHDARAILLNGSQAREHSLRDQIEGLRTQIRTLERELVEERASVKRGKERLDEARSVEEELREDIDEMMEALDRVDRYEEAYEMLVSEIVQLGLGDKDLDRLQAMSEKTLGVSTAKEKLKYVEEVKVGMDNIAEKLARAEWERDQARAEGMNLRRELSVFQTVTGLNGWTNASRSASTPPVRASSTTPLERIAESSAMSSSGMPTRAEMRALGLGLPSTGVPRPGSTTAPSERRISRALSFAMEAEGMTE